MTSATEATWNDPGLSKKGRKRLRCGYPGWKWRPLEIAAMVLGFIVFWPIGLAVLLYVLWRKQRGEDTALPHWVPRIGPHTRSTGNSAFEDWKQAELDRLEEERRKLASAQQEFESFLDNLKRAKDREEFDRFMGERNRPAAA